MQKKKPLPQRKQKEEVNKKALIWAGSIVGGVIVIMTILLIING